MKILSNWLREFVDLPADDRTVAHDLTQAGINIEGIDSVGGETIFEAEITTNRPDAMNHYGVARECAAIYDKELRPLSAELRSASPAESGQTHASIAIIGEMLRGISRFTAPAIFAGSTPGLATLYVRLLREGRVAMARHAAGLLYRKRDRFIALHDWLHPCC